MSEIIELPVSIGFDNSKIVGKLIISKDALPPTPDYTFALGYRYISGTEYELLEVSIVLDVYYARYLEQYGKI